MREPKLIIITMGDPAGIGPEILNFWLESKTEKDHCYIVCGSSEFLSGKLPEWDGAVSPGIFQLNFEPQKKVEFGSAQAEAGRLSFIYLETAVEVVEKNPGAVLVTLPISKDSWHLAGISFLGHTEYLRERAGVASVLMYFHGSEFSIGLSTVHEPLYRVPELITTELLLSKLRIIRDSRWLFDGRNPDIGVLGLNPHAGEAGLMGSEEKIIAGAIEAAGQEGIAAAGPLVPDAFFKHKSDCYLAQYHDQGLIPFKIVHGLIGANLSLGLPYLRISVTHGTAFDIAGSGKADPAGFLHVLGLAKKWDFAAPVVKRHT